MEILKGKNLSHSFEFPLFNNLNLSLNCGESVAILGISGCGKSTLLHIFCTLLKPQQGEIFYKNNSIYKLNSNEILQIRRNDFGIIFQSHYLFKGFLAIENIELATILSNQNLDKNLCQKLKIDKILHQKVGELSGGQQQRVSIARVLSKKPKIIFADEPTGNLDKNTANDVMDVIFNYIKEENAALFLVTHDENLASKCTNKFLLNDQKLNKI